MLGLGIFFLFISLGNRVIKEHKAFYWGWPSTSACSLRTTKREYVSRSARNLACCIWGGALKIFSKTQEDIMARWEREREAKAKMERGEGDGNYND